MGLEHLHDHWTVRLGHTDAAGVMFFPAAFEMEQEFFERWLEAGGMSVRGMLEGALAPTPVVHCEADYRRPVRVGDRLTQTAADGNGPVSALDAAVRRALEESFPGLSRVALRDYKVRIINPGGGADAAVRVLVESTDGVHLWRTVGASTDVVEASWLALQDSYEYWVLRYHQ